MSCATATPSSTSEWPDRYFVTLCTTTSAPVSSGRCRIGVAKVLSTTSSAPAAADRAPSASRSTTLSIGLVGDSAQTRSAPCTASAVAAASVRSTSRTVSRPLLLHPPQHLQAAVVGVRPGDHDTALRRQVQRRCDGGQPGRERRRHPALEGADRALEHLPGRVAVAAVTDLPAGVVGRRHHQRRVHRPVRLPGWPAGGHRHGGRGQRRRRARGAWLRVSRSAPPSVGSAAMSDLTRPDGDPQKPPRRARVAVVFGGRSTEHAVSCVSAGSVLAAIDRDRYDVVPVGISREGRWVLAADDPAGAGHHRRSSCPRWPATAPRSCSPATRPTAGSPSTSRGRCPSSSARSTSSCRCCTAPTARTARCRDCSSWPACRTSGPGCSRRRPPWTRGT